MPRIIVFTLLISLTLQGCKKDDLKIPTDVNFNMDINRNPSNSGHLIFNSGSILIADFSIEGTRQEGDPIAFSKSFPQGLSVSFSPTNTISELFFNIPQGVYTDLDISFETFDDNGGITILVEGQYTNPSGLTFPLRFEFLSGEFFSINGESGSGSGTIILNKDTPVTTFVKFDPIYWFGTISNTMFNNADLVNIGGQMTILINESNNSDIYDIVADRIDETTSATFY